MKRIKSIISIWIPFAVVILLLSGVIYVVAQQGTRIGANDPQIQIAEDAATALGNGLPIDSVLPTTKMDIGSSLSPFLTVFDESGKAIASSGTLHNQLPVLPSGVFEAARQHEDRITWQPEPSVRSATVIVHFGGAHPGFVLSGRSLREVEQRTDLVGNLVGFGALATMLATLIAITACQLVQSVRP
jgi:hypothetical protein